MNTRGLEVSVGAFMAAGLIALFFLAMQVSNL
ncbi:MAG: outer membrane lipid asymmetry maintenance protein MlaD, partial [gamma proteobacterium symbiont of Ctena orbiculata]